MKRIRPLPLREKYFSEIEAEIMRILDEEIYSKLMAVIKPGEKLNSINALHDAVISGGVYYQDGAFYGKFNAKVSRSLRDLGAKFDKRKKAWVLKLADVPADIRIAQNTSDRKFAALREKVVAVMDNIKIDSIDAISRLKNKYNQSIEWMDGDFEKAVKAFTITPKLTDYMREKIATEWANNLDLYVKNWADESIIKLRKRVTSKVFEGRRAEDMVAQIQRSHHVSQKKAAFLARQETALLMSKFHESRYREAGSVSYIWSGANDERERPDHKALNGKTFFWDSPPVVDQRTGRTGHPGEDFGCRCVPIALIS